MSKKVRLNESDLRYMIRKAVNEILSMEGEEEPQDSRNGYYFNNGWKKDSDNPFNAEGSVGEGYENFVAELQEYFQSLPNSDKYTSGERWIKRAQGEIDEFLAKQKAKFERSAKRYPEYAEHIQKMNQRKNEEKGGVLVWGQVSTGKGWESERFYIPLPLYCTDEKTFVKLQDTLKHAEARAAYDKQALKSDFSIEVDMPYADNERYRWRDFAQLAPPAKSFAVDPENPEEAMKKAWNLFNEYAQRTPEVIGWYLWQWSTFKPTIKPILTPKIGKIIEDENESIRRFYASYGPGDYVGD